MSQSKLPSLSELEDQIKSSSTDTFDFNPNALRAEAAGAFIQEYVNSVREQLATEKVGIFDALNRILGEDIASPINVPAADNSAMDGFAFNSQVLSSNSNIRLEVVGTVLAGSSESHPNFNASTSTLKIMTGAVMPSDCDTVIPIELVNEQNGFIEFDSKIIKAGDNRRLLGEDLQAGKPALHAGKLITPSDLGLIASLGIANVLVKKKLSVAFFSTGDEIASIGETLRPGQVFDSNRYTLFGMLSRLGVNVIDMGVIKDDPVLLREAFMKAADLAEVIITSGGVSVGEADFTKKIMRELGDVAFWKLAIKPGRPMAFGKVKSSNREAVLFGLPGNPVAVMVTFYQFVQAALRYMTGANRWENTMVKAKLGVDFKKRPGRTEYLRGKIKHDANGKLWVEPAGSQGSGILRSMSEADCLIILGHDQTNLKHGDEVNITLFVGLI